MPTVEITDAEYAAIQRMRLSFAEKKALINQEVEFLEKAREARMTAEEKALAEAIKQLDARARMAYLLLRQKADVEQLLSQPDWLDAAEQAQQLLGANDARAK